MIVDGCAPLDALDLKEELFCVARLGTKNAVWESSHHVITVGAVQSAVSKDLTFKLHHGA
jgi:hypothetical protein